MKSDCYSAVGVPVIRGTNISQGRGFVGDFVFIPDELADTMPACNVYAGDLVFPHRGAIGEVGVVPDDGKRRYMLSTSLMKLSVDSTRVEPLYVYYFFKSRLGRHELLKNASQVGTPGIATPLTSLKAIELPLPPLDEQQAIASILGSLDDKIELNRRMNRTLEDMAAAIFKAWFVDFEPVHAKASGATSFPGMPQPAFDALPATFTDSELGPIPEGWSNQKVEDVCVSITSGGTPKTSEPRYWGGELPWLSSGETRLPFVIDTEKCITQSGADGSSARRVRRGCTVIASAGQGKTRGQTSFLFLDTYINQSVLALIPNPKQICDEFVYLALSTRYDELRRISDAHSSRGSLTKGLVGSLPVVRPTLGVSTAFQEVVGLQFELIVANLRESKVLSETRDTLLPKLLSGEVRVSDAERQTSEIEETLEAAGG
ncbi:MAG: restriction endonuclease subunit S [Phycisphaeraceae bacterium]